MSDNSTQKSRVGFLENHELYVMISVVVTNLVVIVVMRETLMRRIGLRSLKGIDCIMLAYMIILSVFALDLVLNIVICESSFISEPIWARYLFYRLENVFTSLLESIFLYYGFVMRNVEIKLLIGTLELHVIISKLRNQIYLTWSVFLSYFVLKLLDVLIYGLSFSERLRSSTALTSLRYF